MPKRNRNMVVAGFVMLIDFDQLMNLHNFLKNLRDAKLIHIQYTPEGELWITKEKPKDVESRNEEWVSSPLSF